MEGALVCVISVDDMLKTQSKTESNPELSFFSCHPAHPPCSYCSNVVWSFQQVCWGWGSKPVIWYVFARIAHMPG